MSLMGIKSGEQNESGEQCFSSIPSLPVNVRQK